MPHTRPPQASRVLRPAGSLNCPRRPLSRGFDQAGCPAKPLVSYQINRQLSGWNLPPLVIRAVGAHWEIRDQIVPAIEEPRVKPRFGDEALGVGPELGEHSVNLLGCAQLNKASAEGAMRACNPAFGRRDRDEAPVFPCSGTMKIHINLQSYFTAINIEAALSIKKEAPWRALVKTVGRPVGAKEDRQFFNAQA